MKNAKSPRKQTLTLVEPTGKIHAPMSMYPGDSFVVNDAYENAHLEIRRVDRDRWELRVLRPLIAFDMNAKAALFYAEKAMGA